jgi:hypothetical protein
MTIRRNATLPVPARVRAFIDFVAKHIGVGDPMLKRTGNGQWKYCRA